MTALKALMQQAEDQFIESWTKGPQHQRWTTPPVQVGDRAPDATLPDHTGAIRNLSQYWRDRPALVMFWRHFACGCGLDRAERLRKELGDYIAAGAKPVIVGQGGPTQAAAYRAEQELDVDILTDRDESVYRAYGLLDGSPAQVLFDAPQEMWPHDRATGEEFQRQRRERGRPLVNNPWLLPGEFVIGTDGRILHAHRYQHCENYPEPLVLVAALTGGA